MVTASVVICTTKKSSELKELQRQLDRQTFRDFEILIASEKGIVNAMNCALGRAQGDIFIRIDDDVEIPERWLEELLKPFSDTRVGGVTGPTFVPRERRTFRDSIRLWQKPSRFLKFLTDGAHFRPGGIYRCGSVSYDSNYRERFTDERRPLSGLYKPDHLEGTNWAMRTKLIRKVGGFDPKFDGVAEWFDTDAEQKIMKLGYTLEYNPDAWLWHLLEFTEHYNDRFDGFGRIKNWLRYHKRHSKFHWKMILFLITWGGYFLCKSFRRK